MSFSKIARVYDRFNDISSYEDWLDFTLNSLSEQPQKALDVACGTGWFPVMLQAFVGEMTAIDIDEEMLKIAKKEDPNSQIIYRQADMLALEDYANQYDLVTCFADSLCFLDNETQVTTAIQQMFNALESGGTLLFDVWTPYQVTNGFKDFNYFDSDEKGAIMWDSEVDEQHLQVEHYLTVFDQMSSDGLYQRFDTVLTERTYPLDFYQSILAKLPTQSIEVLVDFGEDEYRPKRHSTTERWFFRVVKK